MINMDLREYDSFYKCTYTKANIGPWPRGGPVQDCPDINIFRVDTDARVTISLSAFNWMLMCADSRSFAKGSHQVGRPNNKILFI